LIKPQYQCAPTEKEPTADANTSGEEPAFVHRVNGLPRRPQKRGDFFNGQQGRATTEVALD
jgi:hypothetical protein